MFDIQSLGKILLIVGGSIALLGLLFLIGGRLFPWLGKLPGDISFQRGNVSCFFPLVSMIVLSLILTVLLNIIIRFLNR